MKFFKRIQLYFNPPTTGDVFFADPLDFMCDSHTERVFFSMIDRHGQNLWHFIPEANAYRFTITNSGMPYYVCDVEILAINTQTGSKCWLNRARPRRIWKKDFHRLMLEGRMLKTTAQSLFHGKQRYIKNR